MAKEGRIRIAIIQSPILYLSKVKALDKDISDLDLYKEVQKENLDKLQVGGIKIKKPKGSQDNQVKVTKEPIGTIVVGTTLE